jgi:hypothetical protein
MGHVSVLQFLLFELENLQGAVHRWAIKLTTSPSIVPQYVKKYNASDVAACLCNNPLYPPERDCAPMRRQSSSLIKALGAQGYYDPGMRRGARKSPSGKSHI